MKLFDSVQYSRPKLNKFDLSHEKKLTFNMSELIPVFLQEILPGDSFRVNTEVFVRLQPLLAPIMQRLDVYVHYFFVPNRLVWDEWEDFITGGREGTSAPIHPYIHINQDRCDTGLLDKTTLADYFGLPTIYASDPAPNELDVSALPFRAFQTIYNEYYRDQNLEAELVFSKGSGVVSPADFLVIAERRRRAWRKDYFTSALPWAQRGAEVRIPVESVVDTAYNKISGLPMSAAAVVEHDNTGQLFSDPSVPVDIELRGEGVNVTINELRRSIKLQEWLEKNARGGARYVEQILSHFGVVSSDARLQRPEYLGGGRQPIVISEVLSTFQEPEGSGKPQGNMAGHGISVGNQAGFRRRFEEHGFVIGIMSVIPQATYQNGVERMWRRFDKLDYYWPEFAQLGEQAILNHEIFYDPKLPSMGYNPTATWGYQSRYAEYKYGRSTVHGDFRDSLSFWLMGRKFTDVPPLNQAFVTTNAFGSPFAVQDEDVWANFMAQIYHKVDALRPMPYFGVPSI